MSSTLSGRQATWAFVLGCVAVTLGVLAHLPMFAMARTMHYRLAGMPMDPLMLAGMASIVAGTLLAAYGLLPRQMPPAGLLVSVATIWPMVGTVTGFQATVTVLRELLTCVPPIMVQEKDEPLAKVPLA